MKYHGIEKGSSSFKYVSHFFDAMSRSSCFPRHARKELAELLDHFYSRSRRRRRRSRRRRREHTVEYLVNEDELIEELNEHWVERLMMFYDMGLDAAFRNFLLFQYIRDGARQWAAKQRHEEQENKHGTRKEELTKKSPCQDPCADTLPPRTPCSGVWFCFSNTRCDRSETMVSV